MNSPVWGKNLRPAGAAGVRPEDDGKFVAIDVGSGDYEIDETTMRPSRDCGLGTRRPMSGHAAGYPTTYRMGVVR